MKQAKRILTLAVLFALLLPQFSHAQTQKSIDPEYDAMLHDLLHFDVPNMTCQRLKDLDAAEVLLLDARPYEEFAVSHLKGALRIGFNDFRTEYVENVDKDKLIVVYCSVGYRSERVAKKLQKMGYTNVHNLYGGIFEWHNLDYKVVDAFGIPTEKVHVVDPRWAKWLDAKRHTVH